MSSTNWTPNRTVDRILGALALAAAGIILAPILLVALVAFIG